MVRVRPDLSSREVEEMVEKHGPGSADEYLRLRRQELAAEEEERREDEDRQQFVERFVAAGGNRADALAELKRQTNERAADAAHRSDEAASEYVRRHVSSRL